jgi:hypothetical protein
MAEYNGGFKSYADRVTPKVFFRAEDRNTKTITIASGQVLKAHSFIETNSIGKGIAHAGYTESALVTFNANLAAAGTITLGTTGIVFTAGSAGATIANLVNVFSTYLTGTTTAAANLVLLAAGIPVTVGTFTSTTTSPAFNGGKFDANTVVFNSSSPLTNAADLAVASSGTAPTISIVAGLTAALNKIAGVLLYDVNATGADVQAEVYTEASFWADALVWAIDPAVDVVTAPDGTTTACTAYNTGCAGNSVSSNLLKLKFVEGSEFEPLGILNAGDLA